MRVEETLTVTAEPGAGQGTLEVKAKALGLAVAADVEVVGVGVYKTPFTLALNAGTYALKASYGWKHRMSRGVTITEAETTRVLFDFTWAYLPTIASIAVGFIGVGVALKTKT